MTDAAAHLYPWLPVRLVMRNRYNSLRRIRNYHGPLFQCHGTGDEVVPIELGRALFEAAPDRFKQFHEIPFARHNDGLPPNYYAALAEFLDRVDEAAPEMPATHRRTEAATGVVAEVGLRGSCYRALECRSAARHRFAVSAVWAILV